MLRGYQRVSRSIIESSSSSSLLFKVNQLTYGKLAVLSAYLSRPFHQHHLLLAVQSNSLPANSIISSHTAMESSSSGSISTVDSVHDGVVENEEEEITLPANLEKYLLTRFMTAIKAACSISNDGNTYNRRKNDNDMNHDVIEGQEGVVRSYQYINDNCEIIAKMILKKISLDRKVSQSVKMIHDTSIIIVKVIQLYDIHQLMDLMDGKIYIHDMIAQYTSSIVRNRNIYNNIQNHHKILSLYKNNWSTLSNDNELLKNYSEAASLMGQKSWVIEANNWMIDFAISYFRYGGARKHYLKYHYDDYEKYYYNLINITKMKRCNEDITSVEDDNNDNDNDNNNIKSSSVVRSLKKASRSREDRQKVINSLLKDLMKYDVNRSYINNEDNHDDDDDDDDDDHDDHNNDNRHDDKHHNYDDDKHATDRKIRLLDVGSCYNPLVQSPNASLFDITAIDLYPSNPTVFQCDFLNLDIGLPNSSMVLHHDQRQHDHQVQDHSDGIDEANQADVAISQHTKLLQLPSSSYDVITMSLVLSYLPTPQQRLVMIKKARQLLVSPGHHSYQHYTGLLLIVEKESIFNNLNNNNNNNIAMNHLDALTVGNNRSMLLTHWKKAICNEGFELVKYDLYTTGSRKTHVFAFATTPYIHDDDDDDDDDNAMMMTMMKDKNDDDDDKQHYQMHIRQDFDLIQDNYNDDNRDNSRGMIYDNDKKNNAINCINNIHLNNESSIGMSSSYSIKDESNNNNVIINSNSNNNNSINNSTHEAVDIDMNNGHYKVLPIGIVGGGIGGSALALSLQRKGIPFRLFEKGIMNDDHNVRLSIDMSSIIIMIISLNLLISLSANHLMHKCIYVSLYLFICTCINVYMYLYICICMYRC